MRAIATYPITSASEQAVVTFPIEARWQDLPAELAAETRLEGRGVLVWLVRGSIGVLLWIDRPVEIGDSFSDDIRVESSQFNRLAARIEPGAPGWIATTTAVNDPRMPPPIAVR